MMKTYSSERGSSHSKPASQRSKKSTLNLAYLNDPTKLQYSTAGDRLKAGSQVQTCDGRSLQRTPKESPYGFNHEKPL